METLATVPSTDHSFPTTPSRSCTFKVILGEIPSA
jgi:hypothetical protein